MKDESRNFPGHKAGLMILMVDTLGHFITMAACSATVSAQNPVRGEQHAWASQADGGPGRPGQGSVRTELPFQMPEGPLNQPLFFPFQ